MELLLVGIIIGVIVGLVVGLAIRAMRRAAEPAKHAEEIGKLRREHAEYVARLQKNHAEEAGRLETENAEAVGKLRTEHAEYVSRLNSEHEQDIERNRKEAVEQSRNVLKGKIGEHMVPLTDAFRSKYEPSEARFLGAPIDYIIFENMDSDDNDKPVVITLADVKKGKTPLSKKQRRIEEAVEQKRVRWDVIRLDDNSGDNAAARQSL